MDVCRSHIKILIIRKTVKRNLQVKFMWLLRTLLFHFLNLCILLYPAVLCLRCRTRPVDICINASLSPSEKVEHFLQSLLDAVAKHWGKIGALLIIVDAGCQVESQFELHLDYFNGSRGWSALGEFFTLPESINYSLLQTTSVNSYNFQKMLQFFKKIKGRKEYKTSAAITGQTQRLLGQREQTEKP